MAKRFPWRWAALAMSTALATYASLAAEPNTLEYAVKANFLYKFGDYFSWPADALGAPSDPVVVCIAGGDPFGPLLDKAIAGEHIGEHPIAIRRLTTVTADSACHILYVRDSTTQRIADALKAVGGKPVLTITDVPDGQGSVGIINFVLRQNKVRFEIDEQTAAESRLDVSSKLLSLAVTVRPRASRGAGQ